MKTRKGFTVIEVVVALVILFLIAVGIYGLSAYTYSYMKLTEEKAIAKNIAMYTVEYIRSRNVTSDNLLDHSDTELGMDNNHYLPGIVDLWDIPLTSIGHPKGSVASSNFSTYCINVNEATPKQPYSDAPNAYYFSLQLCQQ
jgi:prepilin-type N-terminal cleavage/methylation domain-containing protein